MLTQHTVGTYFSLIHETFSDFFHLYKKKSVISRSYSLIHEIFRDLFHVYKKNAGIMYYLCLIVFRILTSVVIWQMLCKNMDFIQ